VGDLVYRRPILTGAPVLAALVLMAAPMLFAQFSSPDDRVLREGHDARAAGDILREDFTGSSSAATVGIVSSDVQIEDLESYAVEASQIDGVDNVMAITGTYVDGELVSPAPPGMDNQLESE
jgi:RND superfamily putative drug exporter